MKRPYCVGLTGGVGCGKSIVANLFSELGVDVVDTDLIARALTARDGGAMMAIRTAFGDDCLTPDGALDRARMRAKVFTDTAARHRLEAILHPMIRARAEAALVSALTPYVILVVPLLLETAAYHDLVDRILVVDCEPAQQIARIMGRDGLTDSLAKGILAAQASRESRLAVADDVIDNRGAANALRGQVEALHRLYLSAARDRLHEQALQ